MDRWINYLQARASRISNFPVECNAYGTYGNWLHPTRVNNLFKKNWWWLKSNDRIWPLIDISWDKQWFKRSLRIFVVMSVFFSSPSSSPSSSPRDVHNFCKWWLSEEGGWRYLLPFPAFIFGANTLDITKYKQISPNTTKIPTKERYVLEKKKIHDDERRFLTPFGERSLPARNDWRTQKRFPCHMRIIKLFLNSTSPKWT